MILGDARAMVAERAQPRSCMHVMAACMLARLHCDPMRRMLPPLLTALVIALAACGGGGGDDDDPTPALTSLPTALPTGAGPSDAIRSIDLESTPPVQSEIARLGASYVQANVLYADVTGDGVEDAIVPLSSGGTLGDVAVIVVTPANDGDGVEEILTIDSDGFGISAHVLDGNLVTYEPMPGPDDPLCCPSEIRTTTYVGDGGTGLAVLSTVVGPPDGASTPAPED